MINKYLLIAFAFFVFTSCSKENDNYNSLKPSNSEDFEQRNSNLKISNPFYTNIIEDFEIGSKVTYLPDSVVLKTGKWFFSNAEIGKSVDDMKTGNAAARITANGFISFSFDSICTISSISVKYATFGSDFPSTWGLFISKDNGLNFSQIGQTIESQSFLQNQIFAIKQKGYFIIQIRKLSGGADQLNFDDIVIVKTKPIANIVINAPADNDNLLLGNPSLAQTNILLIDNYLMDKGQYILSYNRTNGRANWVSWYVGSSSLGNTPRQDDFRADNTLPSGWYQVGTSSYSNSGFDRGHNCPSADRNSSVPANSSTFLMTNIIPQAPNNNQQTWGNFEDYTRSLVNAGNEVFVVMGSYGSGGTGSKGFATTINNGNVKVPSRIWKIVVVIPNGTRDLARINSTTRIIAIDTPNINTLSTNWRLFRTSVDAIETSTGYDLMSSVSVSLQNILEARVDTL